MSRLGSVNRRAEQFARRYDLPMPSGNLPPPLWPGRCQRCSRKLKVVKMGGGLEYACCPPCDREVEDRARPREQTVIDR